MKGSLKINLTSGGDNSGSSTSAGSSSSGAADSPAGGKPYLDLRQYPTRTGSTHVFFTWNAVNTEISGIVSIKMYFTSTPWNRITFNTNWQIGDENPFSDSMEDVVIRDIGWLEEGDLGEDWWFRTDDTIWFAIQYYAADGRGWCTYKYLYAQTKDNCITSSSPSLSYSNGILTIGSLAYGRRVIEFHRTDIPYGDGSGISDESDLNEMFYTSLLNMEWNNPYYGYYRLANNPVLHRWPKGHYSVGVNFKRESHRNNARISSAIDDALAQINVVMNNFDVYFIRDGSSSGDITIIVDTESNLYGIDIYNDDYVYGGTWETNEDSVGNITSATVRLACDFQDAGAYFVSYETVAFEEILQCMGAGFDQVEYPHETIHTDFNYYNKQSSMYIRDEHILRLVYSDLVNTGDSYYEVCRKLNIPKGAYMPSSSNSNREYSVNVAEFATRGGTYEVRVFIVNSSGEVSGTSGWFTIQVPEIVISPWDWNASNGLASAQQTQQFYRVLQGLALPENGFSYLVWNDLVDKIAEVLDALGQSWYAYSGYDKENCKVRSGDAISASKYNEVRVQVGSIISTGIADRQANDEVQGRFITILTDTLNSIIATRL